MVERITRGAALRGDFETLNDESAVTWSVEVLFLAKPDEAPVATMVFEVTVIFFVGVGGNGKSLSPRRLQLITRSRG